jgi:hypothetical protein
MVGRRHGLLVLGYALPNELQALEAEVGRYEEEAGLRVPLSLVHVEDWLLVRDLDVERGLCQALPPVPTVQS